MDSIVAKQTARRLKTLESDREHAAELERCRRDVCHFIGSYCYTYDPRPEAAPHHLPFKLYDYQRDYLTWLNDRYAEGRSALVEKSRDMGATWVSLAWLVWHWRFDDSFQALLGSRKEDLVDNGELDSLFGRVAYIVDRLPRWMLPRGYVRKKHRTHMSLVNPESGNALLGESANENFARQGRYSVILLDEFAFWEWAKSVWTGTKDASWMRVVLSTPNGQNEFSRLRRSNEVSTYTLHWRLHPKKDDAWYQKQLSERTPEAIAQELDISYDRSVMGRVYPEWHQVPRGEFPYVAGWPLYVSWDFGLDDNTALIWWARNPRSGLWRIVDSYQGQGKTIDFYVPLVTGRLLSGLPYRYSEADIAQIESHATWPAAVHYGDPAGNQRNQVTGTSVIDELGKQGIYVRSRPDVNTFEARWQASKLFLRRIEGINSERCIGLDDALMNARFPERRENSQATTEIAKPIHDWTSHFRTALEYMAVNEPKLEAQQAAKPQRTQSAWERMRR
jgi:hypothetical protein